MYTQHGHDLRNLQQNQAQGSDLSFKSAAAFGFTRSVLRGDLEPKRGGVTVVTNVGLV